MAGRFGEASAVAGRSGEGRRRRGPVREAAVEEMRDRERLGEEVVGGFFTLYRPNQFLAISGTHYRALIGPTVIRITILILGLE